MQELEEGQKGRREKRQAEVGGHGRAGGGGEDEVVVQKYQQMGVEEETGKIQLVSDNILAESSKKMLGD